MIEKILEAYVNENTSVQKRIFNAVYVVQYIRIWRQFLFDQKISAKHFITQNSWEGLELNLLLLLNLVSTDNSENIHLLNSQVCEKFFRSLRSFTGVESTVVNCTIKSFISRVHKMQLEEILMTDLSATGLVKFPKMLSRDSMVIKPKAGVTRAQVDGIISEAMLSAQKDAAELGMNCSEIHLDLFLKKTNIQHELTQIDEENPLNDYLGAESDVFNSENCDSLSLDEILQSEDSNVSQDIIEIQKLKFTAEKSGKNFILLTST